jgi:DKNYY family
MKTRKNLILGGVVTLVMAGIGWYTLTMYHGLLSTQSTGTPTFVSNPCLFSRSVTYWDTPTDSASGTATSTTRPPFITDECGVWALDTKHDRYSLNTTNQDAFKVIGNEYSTDGTRVFFQDVPIPDADLSTFTLLYPPNTTENAPNHGGYAKDGYRVYFQDESIEHADPDTFTVVDTVYGKDAKHVYMGVIQIPLDIDPVTFSTVTHDVIRDRQHIYMKNTYDDSFVVLSEADAGTFEYMGVCGAVEKSMSRYYKDKDTVFINGESAPMIDAPSFSYLGAYYNELGMPYAVSYAKDSNYVYTCGGRLEDADPTTFVDLKDGYARDAKRIWYLGKQVAEADIDMYTFVNLGHKYAKDGYRVYFEGIPVPRADSATFTVVVEKSTSSTSIPLVYGKDANSVYKYTFNVAGADPDDCTPTTIEGCNPNQTHY